MPPQWLERERDRMTWRTGIPWVLLSCVLGWTVGSLTDDVYDALTGSAPQPTAPADPQAGRS